MFKGRTVRIVGAGVAETRRIVSVRPALKRRGEMDRLSHGAGCGVDPASGGHRDGCRLQFRIEFRHVCSRRLSQRARAANRSHCRFANRSSLRPRSRPSKKQKGVEDEDDDENNPNPKTDNRATYRRRRWPRFAFDGPQVAAEKPTAPTADLL